MLLTVAALIASGPAPAQQSAESPDRDPEDLDYGGGTLRMGAFFVSDLQTSIFAGTTRNPLGGQVQLDRDLGLSDSMVAARLGWYYRFNKRHGMNLEYYELSVDGQRRLSRAISIRGREFDIGFDVNSTYRERIFKVGYNFVFHDEGKVALGISPGLHVSEFDLRIGATEPVDQEERTDVTAPLPVLGGRLQYRITPKLSMIVRADVFLFKTDEEEGSLVDSYVVFEHRTFERVHFGGGVSRFQLNLDIENSGTEEIWDWKSIYTGAYAYIAVRFGG